MTVRQTSIEALRKIAESGVLSSARLRVFRTLIDMADQWPVTANEVFRAMGSRASLNQMNIPTRLNELKEIGVVEERGTKACPITGMTVIAWQPVPNDPRPYEKPKRGAYWILEDGRPGAAQAYRTEADALMAQQLSRTLCRIVRCLEARS